MATDATGTPTTLGIPKYNTSNDAPSGLGFNAAMDAIDALIQGRIAKPAGIAAGEVPVWDGSAFVRSSVTRVGPTSLGSGTPDGTKFLRDDGSWQAVGAAGAELDYKQITVPVTAAGTTEGAATAVITGNSVTYDGSRVKVEFWCPEFYTGSAGVTVVLLRDTTVLGYARGGSAGTYEEAFKAETFDTPSAGAHTYAVKAFSGANPTAGIVNAGVGGSGNLLPAFLRVVKA